MKSDPSEKAFVTFRVTGDKLVPDDVTRLLKIRATEVRYKGKPYSTGRSSNIIPTTNVWFFSTDKVVASNSLDDHLSFALYFIGLESFHRTEQTVKSISDQLSRLLSVKVFLEKQSAKAAMSFFWHGGANSNAPTFPEGLFKLLELLNIKTDIDFDKDEDIAKPGRRIRAV